MALASSPLAQVCKGVRNYLDAQLNAPGRSKVGVVLAAPAETANVGAADGEHRLNLFFNHIQPSKFFPDTLSGEIGWVSAGCLVTPFAADEDGVGAGENDLRLLGEVLRIFHEHPMLPLRVDGEEYPLQITFCPLDLDQVNQLWATQGETVYRPSLYYEFRLIPVLPAIPAAGSPLAGSFGAAVTTGVAPADVDGRAPEVRRAVPAIEREDWVPAIAFVYRGRCAYTLAFALDSDELAAFSAPVWIAGQPGETVTLRWEAWDARGGWRSGGEGEAARVASRSIEPDAPAGAVTVSLGLPPPFGERQGQLLLYAERTYRRGADGALLTLRSNPLLVSLYAP